MKLVRDILIGLGMIGIVLSFAAVVLFNRPTWGWQALSIPTGSMRPHIPPGSLVLVHRVPDTTLHVGDVITYTNPRTGKGTITHRIIKKYLVAGRIPAYQTQGDANPAPDAPVIAGLVQGKMLWHAPHIGQALLWAKTWTGIAVLVYLPCLIMMTSETRALNAYWRRYKPYSLLNASNPYHQVVSMRRLSMAGGMTAVLLCTLVGLGLKNVSAHGSDVLGSVTLGPNTLSVVSTNAGGGPGSQTTTTTTTTTCTNDTNVQVNNNSNQSATTDSASVAGNTTSGSATSGTATNTNNSNTSISITNGSCQQ